MPSTKNNPFLKEKTIKVVEIEYLRFEVESESNPDEPHTVDLNAYWGVGWCNCWDFRCRKEPTLKLGVPEKPADFWCKHIRAARKFAIEFLGEKCLDRLVTESRERAYANGEREPW